MVLEFIALAFIALLVVVTAAGQVARWRLANAYRPEGRLVDVGGRRAHVVESGQGPTVVLEGGSLTPAAAWEPVRRALGDGVRVVAVDRAGLGWSNPSPRPRTPEVMAEELHEALSAAALPVPYVVVGHSVGGIIARVFAHRYPTQVGGLVLVDATHEAQFERFPAELRAMNARMARLMPAVFAVLRGLVAAGVVALRPSLVPVNLGPLPPSTLAAIRARVASRPSILATMARELRDLEPGLAGVRALGPGTLGDLPLHVISHGVAEGVPPGLGPEVAEAYERTWQTMQAELAALSSRGRWQVAEGSGHNIPTAAPDLIAEAVREVVSASSVRSVA